MQRLQGRECCAVKRPYFSSARTKTSCLVKEMAKDEQERIALAMKAGPFAISTDGSNTIIYSNLKIHP